MQPGMKGDDLEVFIKYPWKFKDSPYHMNLINNPPNSVKFLNQTDFYLEEKQTKRFTLIKFKEFLKEIRKLISLPNITYTRTKADIVHCAHCLNLSNKPWIVDVENYDSFGQGAVEVGLGKEILKKILKKDQCKKIIPWTKAAKRKIKENIKDREIRDKIEVVYPAVPPQENNSKKDSKITLLHASRYFYEKGGLIALEAFKRLKKMHDINTFFISNVPQPLKNKYKEVNIIDVVPRKKLFSFYYPQSDIFVYPTLRDTFGFAMLEAYSFGIPVVTVNGFSREEIVNDEETGFVILRPGKLNFYEIGEKEKKIVEKVVRRTSALIKDSKTRKKMGKKGRELIEKGRFSTERRNKKMERIYQEALN